MTSHNIRVKTVFYTLGLQLKFTIFIIILPIHQHNAGPDHKFWSSDQFLYNFQNPVIVSNVDIGAVAFVEFDFVYFGSVSENFQSLSIALSGDQPTR